MDEVLEDLAGLRLNGEPIEKPENAEIEIEILLAGGITPRDFKKATEHWVKTERRIEDDFKYIRSVAFKIGVERIAIEREAANG